MVGQETLKKRHRRLSAQRAPQTLLGRRGSHEQYASDALGGAAVSSDTESFDAYRTCARTSRSRRPS